MDSHKLKSLVRDFICTTGLSFPPYSERILIYEDYRKSLKTAPVEDTPETFKQYLRWYFNNKKVKEVKSFPITSTATRNDCVNIAFASFCEMTPQPCVSYECPKVCKEKEVEKTMSLEIETRNYLISRLSIAQNTKRAELQDMFNLYVNQNPRTYKELIDWIKNDKFKLDDKRTKQIDGYVADDDWYGSFTDGITFTGSDRPLDMDGYNAATKEMSKQFTSAKDVIMTSDGTAGLKALQDFEAWTPAKATV